MGRFTCKLTRNSAINSSVPDGVLEMETGNCRKVFPVKNS